MIDTPHTIADRRVARFHRAVAVAQARRVEALAALAAAREWALACCEADAAAWTARHGRTLESYIADIDALQAAVSTGEDAP